MTDRLEVGAGLRATRLVAILRGARGDRLAVVCAALIGAGVRCLEITTNTPGAFDAVRSVTASAGAAAEVGNGHGAHGWPGRAGRRGGRELRGRPGHLARGGAAGRRAGARLVPRRAHPHRDRAGLGTRCDRREGLPDRPGRRSRLPARGSGPAGRRAAGGDHAARAAGADLGDRRPLGAVAVLDGVLYPVPPRPVPVLGPVGAGDGFAAGYLAARCRGAGPGERLATAAATGAFAVTVPGDWEGAPTSAELSLLDGTPDDVVR